MLHTKQERIRDGRLHKTSQDARKEQGRNDSVVHGGGCSAGAHARARKSKDQAIGYLE
jgi:hypothetical protein